MLAPLIRAQKGEYRDLFEDLLKQGFVRARVDGTVVQLIGRSEARSADAAPHRSGDRSADGRAATFEPRLAEAVELALRLGNGEMIVAVEEAKRSEAEGEKAESKKKRAAIGSALSAHYACTHCGISFEPPSPQLFSFNSPQGMCPQCDGLGEIYGFDPDRLVPNPDLSFAEGAIEIVGTWSDMGRWRRHIYQGVADTHGAAARM